MKISELCKMIEDTLHSGKYAFENERQRLFSGSAEVINRSNSEDLKHKDIKIETRVQNLYTLNNYAPNIQHLPGVIETDVLDSFKMLCRRLERIKETDIDTSSKDINFKKKNQYHSNNKSG
jgi:hypothetical protein